eukprot:gene14586-biopygen12246
MLRAQRGGAGGRPAGELQHRAHNEVLGYVRGNARGAEVGKIRMAFGGGVFRLEQTDGAIGAFDRSVGNQCPGGFPELPVAREVDGPLVLPGGGVPGPLALVCGAAVIWSEVGAQQGDPLGPLYFSLALQPVLSEIAADGDLDLCFSYLDDGCIAGDWPAVAKAMAKLKDSAAQIGLELNTFKCELIPAAGVHTSCDLRAFPSDVTFPVPAFSQAFCQSFELLGAPIGDPLFSARFNSERVRKASAITDRIAELNDPQIGLLLLRQCASYGKVVYSCRVTPFDAHGDALADFDAGVRRCFERLTGLFPSASQWRQATLSPRMGGLGLRS